MVLTNLFGIMYEKLLQAAADASIFAPTDKFEACLYFFGVLFFTTMVLDLVNPPPPQSPPPQLDNNLGFEIPNGDLGLDDIHTGARQMNALLQQQLSRLGEDAAVSRSSWSTVHLGLSPMLNINQSRDFNQSRPDLPPPSPPAIVPTKDKAPPV